MTGRDSWSSKGTNKVDLKHFYTNSSIKGNRSANGAIQEQQPQTSEPSAAAVQEEQPRTSEPLAAATQEEQPQASERAADAARQERVGEGGPRADVATQYVRVENPSRPSPASPYLALLSSISAGKDALDLGSLLEEQGTAVCYVLNSLSDVRKDPTLEGTLHLAGATLLVLTESDTFPRWWKDCPQNENTIFVYLDENMDTSVKNAAIDQRVVRAYGYPDSEKLAAQIARLLAASGVVDCLTAGFEMPPKKRESLVGSWDYARKRLDSRQRLLYDSILEKVKALEPIKAGDYVDDVVESIPLIMVSIEADHPELFWIRGYKDTNPLTLFKASSRAMEESLNVDDDIFERIEKMADLNGDGRISFSERTTSLNIYAVARAPEILWGFRKKLKPPSGWTYRSAQDAVSRAATMSSLLKNELSERASDYEILRFLFDCVCRRSWFKSTSRMDPDDRCWCGSGKLYRNCHKFVAEHLQALRKLFEADVAGRPDSAGCARMLQYLLLDFGIPCITVSGLLMTGNRENVHTWNYVQIDGVWNVVDVGLGVCDPDKNPQLLANCPDWAKEDYVRYWFLCADGKNYHPAPTIPAPAIGTSSDYFKNEGNLLSMNDVPSFVRSYAKLLCGREAFIELKCVEDLGSTSTWLTENAAVARGAFVAAMFDYDRLCANIDMYIKAASKQVNVDKQLKSIGVCNSWSKWVDYGSNVITLCLMEKAPVRR